MPQPSDRVPPQPPTFGGHNHGGARPGPGSRKNSSMTLRPPSVASGTQTPVQHPAPPPTTTTIHAPQPRLPFRPSPDWTYAALPPVSNAAHTGIVSTPSWTAVIPAASSGANGAPQISPPSQASALPNSSTSSSALGHGSTPAYAPFQNLQAPSGMPSDPFAFAAAAAAANASGSGSGSVFPFASTSSGTMASPSFPPNATIFSDLPAALSSAPPIGAPPAFFSSYGMYQPVVAPYPRFLTPSPEPSVLGELELELGPSAGEFVPPENNNDGLDEVWKDLEERDGVQQHVSSDGLVHQHQQQPKKDPFEGMTLAQMRSRANSLEAVDRAAATAAATSRYNFYASAEDQIASAAEEVKLAAQAMQTSVSPPSDEAGSNSAGTAAAGGPGKKAKRKANGASSSMAGGNSKKNRSANTVAFAAPAAVDAENDPNPDGSRLALNGGRKNRNPHSTQLPGPRRQGKADGAEDGHEGPICSHCGSVTTPLWRRGPDDELLCNACVSSRLQRLLVVPFPAEHPR